MQNKIDDDFPSAPPLSGTSPIDRVSERLRYSGTEAKPSLRTSAGSSTKAESNMTKSMDFDATEVNTAEASVRYTFGAFPSPSLPRSFMLAACRVRFFFFSDYLR